MSQSRNAACECGSGLKYKRCCGAPGATPVHPAAVGEDSTVETPMANRRWLAPVIMELVAIAVAIVVGVVRDSAADAIAVGMALSMAVAVYLLSRNAPQSTGRGSSTAINFGMTGRRAARKKNRKNRRR